MKRRTLVPWKGLGAGLLGENPLHVLPEEVRQAVESVMSGKPLQRLGSLLQRDMGFEPSVDVEEGATEITVRVELAGMKEDDVELLLNDDVLTIRGEKKVERREEGYYESRHGQFERVIPLGAEVNGDQVSASMSDGVLTVKVPKLVKGQKEGKKITIRGESSV